MFFKKLDYSKYDKKYSDEPELWQQFDKEAKEHIKEKKKERESTRKKPGKEIKKRKYKGESLYSGLWEF